MKFILRSFPIIEEVIAQELRNYLVAERFDERYPSFGVPRIDITHPFALWIDRGVVDGQMLPSVTVASGTDQKTAELSELRETVYEFLYPADIESLSGYGISIEDIARVQAVFSAGADVIYGISSLTPRRDNLTFEIWADSVEIKNRIYNAVEGFLSGPRRMGLWQEMNLYIRAEQLNGQRGNNYNMDFGRVLYGGHVSVPVDYWTIETIYDTEWTTQDDVIHTYEGVVNGA